MINFLLNILASLIKWALQPTLFAYGVIRSLSKREFSKWQFNVAYTKDVWGNALGKYVFDDLLITKEAKYKFGHRKQTISYVLGKNLETNSLSLLGKILVLILNKIEKNHVQNAVRNYPNHF
jgi:hypothetical protein